jgi:hypothetical protein
VICSRCGSAAGASVRIEGDAQGRRYFGCARCGAISSPVPCQQRIPVAGGGIDLCPGHALAWCGSCRLATCREHLPARQPRGRRTEAAQCKSCRAGARRAHLRKVMRPLPPPESLYWSEIA